MARIDRNEKSFLQAKSPLPFHGSLTEATNIPRWKKRSCGIPSIRW